MDLHPPINYKRTKILATVGPAVDSYEKIEEMVLNGVNGFRFNFSHGAYEERDRQIAWVRQAAKKAGKPVAVFQDLQGPKIRLGALKDDMKLPVKKGDELELVYGIQHEGGLRLPVQYDLSASVKHGEVVYMFDGKIRTTALEAANGVVRVRVENDGVLMSKKGLNLPDTDFGGNVLTPKDYEDIDYGAKQDFDYVGLSFVHRASDIEMLRGYLAGKGSRAHIIAKIETKTSIEPGELERIVEASDSVMVARGDLAYEVGPELVPAIQRQIIALCQKHAKPSIVATQVLGTMTDNPQPTRAEVSDIANAVIQGADCIMMSEETAMGQFPIEAIQTMKRTIMATQEHVPTQPLAEPEHSDNTAKAISRAAVKIAKEVHAEAIVAETKSGATAASIAAYRPQRPIICVTSDERVAQQLCLFYGTKSFVRDDGERAGLGLGQELADADLLQHGQTIVAVSGKQPGVMGGTDTIRVRTLE